MHTRALPTCAPAPLTHPPSLPPLSVQVRRNVIYNVYMFKPAEAEKKQAAIVAQQQQSGGGGSRGKKAKAAAA